MKSKARKTFITSSHCCRRRCETSKQIQKPEDTTCHLVTKIGDQPSKLAQILKDHGCKVKELQTGEISYRYDRISKEELAKVTYLILQADMEFMVL